MKSIAKILKSFSNRPQRKSGKSPSGRAKPCLEALEGKLVPANMYVTDAFLANVQGNRVSTPAVGELVYVKVEFNAEDLAAGLRHTVNYTVDGVPLSKRFEMGDAPNGSWSWAEGTWVVTPGAHNVRVELDVANEITESSQQDNIREFAFMAGNSTPKFTTPIAGTPSQDWKLGGYVDLNPTVNPDPQNLPAASFTLDYNGGRITYDGHAGIDMSLTGAATGWDVWAAMASGVPVYAAAGGTVVAAVASFRDDVGSSPTAAEYNPATNTWNLDEINRNHGTEANFVTIDHGNGWQTTYDHLKTNSVPPAWLTMLGNPNHAPITVQAGALIGMVGSSGTSTAPHLHFEVRHNGNVVETFKAPQSYWFQPLPYANDVVAHAGTVTLTGDDGGTAAADRFVLRGAATNPHYFEVVKNGRSLHYPMLGLASITIDSRAGADVIEVENKPANIAVNILAGDGADTITLSPTARFLDGIQGTLTIDGGSDLGFDILAAQDQANSFSDTFTITDRSLTRYCFGTVNYQAMESLFINAGGGSSTFNVESTARNTPVTINAGAGSDTINVTPTNRFLDYLKGNLDIHGEAGADTINVQDQTNTYGDLYTLRSGSVTRSASALITYGGTVENLNVYSGAGNGRFAVESIPTSTRVTIDAGTGDDTLIGPNTVNNWYIMGVNAGDVNGLRFSAFENLAGGNNRDMFLFMVNGVGISGSINGEGGIDTMDYQHWASAVGVNLQNGSASGVGRPDGVRNIENVTGGAGNDNLIGNSIDNLLDGGFGNDTVRGGEGNDVIFGGAESDKLYGDGGRDLLIGGVGADELKGGAGDDLLIGGNTTHPNWALDYIMREWVRTDHTFQQRINYIRNGNGDNGPYVLNAGTVLDDGVGVMDVVEGWEEKDWFFAFASDKLGDDPEQLN